MSYNNEEEILYFPGDKNRGVILFHAYTGSPNDVRMLGRFLNSHGYSVALPTFSGHGTSQPEHILANDTSAWEKDVKRSIQFMQEKGMTKVAVLGLSLGGVYAIWALENYPVEVIGGGAMCSPISPDTKNNIHPVFLQYARHLIKKQGATPLEEQRRMGNINFQLDKQLKQIGDLQLDVYNQLAKINQPVFLAQAEKDELIDGKKLLEVKEKMINAHAEINWYPNSGHVVTVGPDRQALQDDVLGFLNNLAWKEEQT